MKKILISIILCGCKTAVSREIKTETRYNQIEINAAMDEIEMEFGKLYPYWNYLLMKQMSKN